MVWAVRRQGSRFGLKQRGNLRIATTFYGLMPPLAAEGLRAEGFVRPYMTEQARRLGEGKQPAVAAVAPGH